jgi:parallel beta-helix repeat protein
MGTTYFVSASEGNNNNPGNQQGQPLRTIQAAINKAQAGDTISVRAGTYTERLHIQKPGTADAPILITAFQGEQPVIDGINLNIDKDSALVIIQQSQDVKIVGLTIRNSGGRGLLISKSSRITVRATTIESCYAGGLHAGQADDLLVEGCSVHNCARRFLAHGPERMNVALLARNCKNVTIQNNQVYENSDEGIVVSVGCQNVKVYKNTCYDNRNGQISVTSAVNVEIDSNLCYHTGRSDFLTLGGERGPGITKDDLWRYQTRGQWHTRGVKIVNNIVIGCGVGFGAGRKGGKLSNVQVAHNTIVNSTEQAIHLGLRTQSTKSFIENNLIASSDSSEMVHALGGEGIVWRHNFWSNFPGQSVYNPSNDVVDSDIGLVNLNAPVNAGAVTADPYKLVATSKAVNSGIRHKGETLMDFWGVPRDANPDIGASEYPEGEADQPIEDPQLPPSDNRVTQDLVALYEFKEQQGREVRDTSGSGDPLHLHIKDESRISWTEEGLVVNEPVLITTERPAGKIIAACRQSNEITLEAWIRPANVTQDGPARIISISSSKTQRNITLGQGMHGNRPADLYMARLRTTQTSTNGLPAIISPPGTATNNLTHVVYTRGKNGQAILYINGQDRGVLNIGGDFSSWDDQMPLLFGDEVSEDRPWLGLFHLCAIYSRALTPAEVLHNFEAAYQTDVDLLADFSLFPGDELGIVPHVVEFDSSESISSHGIATYFWEFGDGQTSSRANPTVTYNAPGVYTVSLTITDNNGQTDKVVKEELITVVAQPVAPLPADYARFIIVNIQDSRVMAFGIQYPDLRCALMWNEEPNHMIVYTSVDDVKRVYTTDNSMELIWLDVLEETY